VRAHPDYQSGDFDSRPPDPRSIRPAIVCDRLRAQTRGVKEHRYLRFSALLLSAIAGGSAIASCSSQQRGVVSLAETSTSTRASLSDATCLPRQLALSYRGGGFSAGVDTGFIVIRDTAIAPCLLAGSVTVIALDDRQQPLQLSRPLRSVETPGNLVLSADAPPYVGPNGPPIGDDLATILLGGAEWIAPSRQPCPDKELIPAFWKVSMLGGWWIVTNLDPNVSTDNAVRPALYACLGNIGVMQVGPLRSYSASPS